MTSAVGTASGKQASLLLVLVNNLEALVSTAVPDTAAALAVEPPFEAAADLVLLEAVLGDAALATVLEVEPDTALVEVVPLDVVPTMAVLVLVLVLLLVLVLVLVLVPVRLLVPVPSLVLLDEIELVPEVVPLWESLVELVPQPLN